LLAGIKAGLAGQTRLKEPVAWPATYTALAKDSNPVVRKTARELAIVFGNTHALAELRTTLAGEQNPTPERVEALAILAKTRDPEAGDLISNLASQPGSLRQNALGALSAFPGPKTSALLVKMLPNLKGAEGAEALSALLTHAAGAQALLEGIDAGLLKKDLLTAPLARKIQGFNSPQFNAWLENNWGKLNASNYVKRGNIDHFKKFLDEPSVLRADLNRIHVGPRSNIQDGCVVHLSDSLPTVLGELVTVGHKAVLHACSIQSEVLVGMNAVVLDGAEIGARSIIGAGALVTGGKKFPPGSLILGSPARVVRTLPLDEQQDIKTWALKYVALSRAYLARGLQAGGRHQSCTPQP
jgi:carbonic anhydrase/acetyltransferase-like protein (isoleucine patch superfamily)